MLKAYLHHGSMDNHPMQTTQTEVKEKLSSYNRKGATVYIVKFNSHWMRVYQCLYSNYENLYINPRDNKIKVQLCTIL